MIEKVIKILTEIQKEEKVYMGSNYLEDKEDEVVIDMTVNKEEFEKKWKEFNKC